MPSGKRITEPERDMIRALFPKYGVAGTAKAIGRSRTAVNNIVRSEGLRADVRKDAPRDPPGAVDSGAGDKSTLDRLKDLRDSLLGAMTYATAGSMAGLAREYRATLEAIERLEGGDGDGTSAALDTIARSIASKLSS